MWYTLNTLVISHLSQTKTLQTNKKNLGGIDFPSFNTEGTFYGCFCLTENYIILRNRKVGELLGTSSQQKTKQKRRETAWFLNQDRRGKTKHSPPESCWRCSYSRIGDLAAASYGSVYRGGYDSVSVFSPESLIDDENMIFQRLLNTNICATPHWRSAAPPDTHLQVLNVT